MGQTVARGEEPRGREPGEVGLPQHGATDFDVSLIRSISGGTLDVIEHHRVIELVFKVEPMELGARGRIDGMGHG